MSLIYSLNAMAFITSQKYCINGIHTKTGNIKKTIYKFFVEKSSIKLEKNMKKEPFN